MTIRIFLVLTILTSFFSAQLRAETDCSKEAIGYYLEKGFTTEQISRMCQAPALSSTTDNVTRQPSNIDEQATDSNGNNQHSSVNDEVYFNRTILADSITLTPQTLTYVRAQCIEYGEEDITGFKPKVCGVLKTTINRVGLVVLRAVKRLSIFRDAELLVKGEIRREVINLSSLNDDDQKTFSKILDPTPETFNIETRKDADPEAIAARLPR